MLGVYCIFVGMTAVMRTFDVHISIEFDINSEYAADLAH